ncbi:endonuclease/exonuclease/phosphatase family protein [Bifidobacterium pullorum subsp. saeculare]|uniref:endonuclease/exonuclease/phosphatase family protein n=1 Tax=Bifidobacterium pullorum TaxID=78448 RepID=UPI001956FDBD|nr:endonuclease/exonuclease/phosphatase family protein [Bifidobacterium pullorum]MBM6730380.1 endonuclease/exonuclease/phosphatase family protein [Bifidobacterium pullorum subsp. saeculare]
MTIALGTALALLVLWWALRFLPAGAEGRLPLPYLIALIPFLWIPALLLAIVAAVLGCWPLAVAAVVLAMIVALRVPLHRLSLRETYRETHPDTSDTTARGHDEQPDARITVMTLNCRFGRADADAIMDAVRTHDVDVLALQELTADLVGALDSAGIRDVLPHRQLGEDRPTDNGGFNGLWTRLAPVAAASSSAQIPAADVPMIVASPTRNGQPADAPDSAIAFASAHTKSPMRGCRAWSQGIVGLGRLALQRATVVLGDLNCGIDHPSFRKLLAAGFRDASMSALRKPMVSFPSWLAWPRIELDHVLISGGIDAERVETLTIHGSDHLATVAALRIR